MILFAGAIGAYRNGTMRFMARSVYARDIVTLTGLLYQECKRRFPEEEGWVNHAISHEDVPIPALVSFLERNGYRVIPPVSEEDGK